MPILPGFHIVLIYILIIMICAQYSSSSQTLFESKSNRILPDSNRNIPNYDDDEFPMEKWEQAVQAAPIVANWMGILMVTLSKRDVALSTPAGYPFLYMTKTSSLRNAVTEMNTQMSQTFDLTHDDFIRIQTNVAEIPVHVKAILTLINMTMPSTQLNLWLPYALRNMGRLVNETNSMMQATKIRFDHVLELQLEVSALLTFTISNLAAAASDAHITELRTQLGDVRAKWNELKDLVYDVASSIANIQRETLFELIPVSNYALVDGIFADTSDYEFFLQLLADSSTIITTASVMLNARMPTIDVVFHRWTIWQSTSDVQTLLNLTRDEDRIKRIRDFWYKNAQSSIGIARLTQRQQMESRTQILPKSNK